MTTNNANPATAKEKQMAKPEGRVDLIAEGTSSEGNVAMSEDSLMDQKAFPNSIPFGRLGTPEEIAEAVVFLASDENDLTGMEFIPDTENPQA